MLDVMRRLTQTKNILVNFNTRKGAYISILNVIQGDVDAGQIHKSLQRIRERKEVKLIEWGPASIQVALANKSPYVESSHKVSGLMLANHTNTAELFQGILKKYNPMKTKGAYLDSFKQTKMFSDNLDEFDEAK